MSQPTGPYLRGDLSPLPPDRESEAALRQVHPMRFAWRNRHATIPLATPVAMFAAAEILRGVHHPLDVLVVTSAVSAVTWFKAPHKWDRAAEVTYARATAIGAGAWLTLAAYAGVGEFMEILLGLGCATWGGIYWWHKRPRDKRKRREHALRVARWNAWWQSHAPRWGVAGSGIIDVRDHGAMEGLLIQLWGGQQTWQTVKNLLPLVESALGGHGPDGSGYVHHGMSRVEVNKRNPSQVWLYLKREDPLKGEIEWDDSESGDIRDPAVLGTRETGTPLRTALRASWFAIGVTRSGKSNELSVMLAKITKCRNARAFLIDMKGGRAARPWLPAMDWVATTTDEADLMIGFVHAEVKIRGGYADSGEEQLEPTDEVPTLFLVIDETYEVTSDMSKSPGTAFRRGLLATIASQGSGLEVYVIDLTQYGGLEESVGTEQIRANLRRRMCFQTEDARHGMFALGQDIEKYGIDSTKLEQKGTFYYREDSKTSPEQIRGPHIRHKMARQIAERNAERTDLYSRPLMAYCGAQPVSPDPGAPTWQQVYESRWSRLPERFVKDAPQAQLARESQAVTATTTPPETMGMDATKINMIPVHPDAVRINEDIDSAPPVSDADIGRARDLRAARGEPPIDFRSEREKAIDRFAALLASAGPDGITPRQLARGAGISESWVYQTLGKLTETGGAVAKLDRGRYAGIPQSDITGSIRAMRRDAGELASAARDLTKT